MNSRNSGRAMIINKNGLIYKLGLNFAVFLVVTLIISGVMTYLSQMAIYKDQCGRNIKSVVNYLSALIKASDKEFLQYKRYYDEHYTEVDIPYDANEYISYRDEYEELFAKHHPGKTLGKDISFEELDEEVRRAWFIYMHLYWLLTFEQARASFNIPYTYVIIPDETEYTVVYMLDAVRQNREEHNQFIREHPEYKALDHYQGDEKEYMYLGDEFVNPYEDGPVLWETWEKGEAQEGYKIWHNQWGDTYAYYAPIWADGEKVGLAGAEIDIADVNEEIIRNTLRQLAVIAIVLTACLAVAILFINRKYISKLIRLENSVKEYTASKDASVVRDIDRYAKGKDEIASLSGEISSMILEMENYLKSITKMDAALTDEKLNSARMTELAQRDSLTGIRNAKAYELEIMRLEQEMKDGLKDFGIAMVDLVYLKGINDTYGHEQGNRALQKLSYIVCHVFQHSPVFRIGGDEFAVILKEHDLEHREELTDSFRKWLEQLNSDKSLEPWEMISAAIGVAIYDETGDTDVDSVKKRAEKLMYEDRRH